MKTIEELRTAMEKAIEEHDSIKSSKGTIETNIDMFVGNYCVSDDEAAESVKARWNNLTGFGKRLSQVFEEDLLPEFERDTMLLDIDRMHVLRECGEIDFVGESDVTDEETMELRSDIAYKILDVVGVDNENLIDDMGLGFGTAGATLEEAYQYRYSFKYRVLHRILDWVEYIGRFEYLGDKLITVKKVVDASEINLFVSWGYKREDLVVGDPQRNLYV